TINAAPTLGALTPVQWTAGVAGYPGVIPVSGGTGPFTVVAQSNLPAGLSATIAGASVVFTGAPTTAGTFANIQVTVQDATGVSVSGTYALTVNNAGSIITAYAGTAPTGVAVDGSGNLFIADADNNVVREVIAATGDIVTIAGTGAAGYSGDN